MELADTIQTAHTLHAGSQDIELVAGKSLKIETTPSGEEVLDVECPAGKVWSARVIVEIIETET